MTRVLCVDDDAALLAVFEDELPRFGLEVRSARSGAAALAALESEDVDVVVTDIHMRGMTGVELSRRIGELRPDIPVLLLTGFGELATAIEAIRAGAYDYLTKPIELDALVLAIRRAAEKRALSLEVERLRRRVEAIGGPTELITESEAMAPVLDLIRRVAPTAATVLIQGESGTGKELVARALHRLGDRAARPFVAVNCAAIPESLLESELFGHVKGAFTGAHEARRGLLLGAEGGTFFLDEVGELPAPLQVKLLRALQTRSVRPLGGAQEEPFDARLVAATNRRLYADVEAGRFREDLYYRLAVIELDLPPLRARGNDVLLLAQHFLGAYAARAGRAAPRLSVAAAQRLLAYRWPGNVRELENTMERAVVLARSDEIVPADLGGALARGEPERPASLDLLLPGQDLAELPPLAEIEDRYIRRVLDAVGGNKTLAAKVLGLDRKTLYRKLGRKDADGGPGDGAASGPE